MIVELKERAMKPGIRERKYRVVVAIGLVLVWLQRPRSSATPS